MLASGCFFSGKAAEKTDLIVSSPFGEKSARLCLRSQLCHAELNFIKKKEKT